MPCLRPFLVYSSLAAAAAVHLELMYPNTRPSSFQLPATPENSVFDSVQTNIVVSSGEIAYIDQISASLGCWGMPGHALTRSVCGDSISIFGATATLSKGGGQSACSLW